MQTCEACGQKKSDTQLRNVGHPTTGDATVDASGKVLYALVCVDAMACQRTVVAQRRLKEFPSDP